METLLELQGSIRIGSTTWREAEEDERALQEPFWSFESPSEKRTIKILLLRRFPQLIPLLIECFEESDPQDTVYPGHTGDYDEVVMELLVLLFGISPELENASLPQLRDAVEGALARRFGEMPEKEDTERAVRLIHARIKEQKDDSEPLS
ncbi:hypothetical protein FHX37_2810 [Haloactinospora alba]|uniref:Uncharacterized protein n=1 Tax=Haloactinospora alba TaxID=405555 RepID=A0A543NLX3_9ACTN|nr:hypothetical protein [Haloactinospora alba]TQN32826.1 hypothetical protein FHX37_2810 [Haloactinospora alba]